MELSWRFYGKISLEIVWGFHGENMVNQIARTVVWRLYGDSVESDIFLWRFYGNVSLEIVWGFHGQNMLNRITRQYPYQFYHKISMKGITLYTVSLLST